MTNSGEVFAGLDELNECEDYLMFPATLNTDGISFNITWLGICLWRSEEDEREFYEEKNEWEPLGQYLIRKQLEVFKDIESELNPRGLKHQPTNGFMATGSSEPSAQICPKCGNGVIYTNDEQTKHSCCSCNHEWPGKLHKA